MNLLITGGAGFVGARLARTLLARGVRQYIADCEASTGREQALKGLAR